MESNNNKKKLKLFSPISSSSSPPFNLNSHPIPSSSLSNMTSLPSIFSLSLSTQPPASTLKRSSSHLDLTLTLDNEDEDQLESQSTTVSARDSISSLPPLAPAITPEDEDMIIVDPTPIPQPPQPTQSTQRTPAQIEQNRVAAQAKLAEKRMKEAVIKRSQLSAARMRIAEQKLGEFGFSVTTNASPSRFGTGQGGGLGIEVKVENDPSGLRLKGEKEEWVPNPLCSEEQNFVLNQVRNGDNIFFTGSAGVGKSFLLKEITRLLERMKRPFQVSATTGIAALNVNGVTVHSWAGCGLGKESLITYVDKIKAQKANDPTSKLFNWLSTQTLIIDEISMMDPDLFTKLSMLGKFLREDPRPFGGIQLILAGDFFQLPPVPEKNPKCPRCGIESLGVIPPAKSTLPYESLPKGILKQSDIKKCLDHTQSREQVRGCGFEKRERRFCFETEAWAECDFTVLELTKVFRQSDPEFITMLEKFRRGICDEASVELLKTCGTDLNGSIKIRPTNLYPHKNAVDSENAREFGRLVGPQYTFEAVDTSNGPRAAQMKKDRLKDVPAAEKIVLKTGAQVLLLTNLDIKRGLVNGSRGVIVDWIHRSQIPKEEDNSGPGATKPRGRKGCGFGGEEWRDKATDEWFDTQSDEEIPLVVFASGVTQAIVPHAWVIDIDTNNAVSRVQMPLGLSPSSSLFSQYADVMWHAVSALAWALTIHKSQGQSLDAVGVRLTSVFEKGQAYVALSRCRTPAGMRVEGFMPSAIMAHETVVAFHDRLALKKPFRDGPIVPVNPLQYIPSFSPYLVRLNHKFGALPTPLPVGSAAQPPSPQAVSLAPVPPAITLPALPPLPLPKAKTSWEALLRSAAADYVSTAQSTPNVSFFVDQARQLVALAIASTPGAKVVEELEIQSSSGEEEAVAQTQEDSQATAQIRFGFVGGGPASGEEKKIKTKRTKKKKADR